MSKLFLAPGNCIGRTGLPGGKLECKKGSSPLEIESKYQELIEDIVPFLKSQGKILDEAGYLKLTNVDSKPAISGKSETRIKLEDEATKLGIEFKSRTSNKDLEALIADKKAETEVANEKLETLREEAKELDIEFDETMSEEDLQLLIEDKLK